MSGNRAREHFERRSFDAVIDVSPYKGSELLEVLQELNVPTVLCGQLEGHPYRNVFSTVYSDDEEGGRFAALAMKERGRKDIVAVLGPQDNPAVVDRLRGYRDVLGESLPDENVVYTGWSSGDGYQAVRQLLAREIYTDGVLCGSDRIATGVIAALNEAGVCVPLDVSVVGFDDHEIAARTVPALTTIRQPLREEGQHGRRHCARYDQRRRAHHHVMHMQLVQRDSL
ncbi:MAG: substrate-binding domain-containing protein [Collinsella sp.]